METAYEVILNNNERVMRDMYGNLNTHCLIALHCSQICISIHRNSGGL